MAGRSRQESMVVACMLSAVTVASAAAFCEKYYCVAVAPEIEIKLLNRKSIKLPAKATDTAAIIKAQLSMHSDVMIPAEQLILVRNSTLCICGFGGSRREFLSVVGVQEVNVEGKLNKNDLRDSDSVSQYIGGKAIYLNFEDEAQAAVTAEYVKKMTVFTHVMDGDAAPAEDPQSAEIHQKYVAQLVRPPALRHSVPQATTSTTAQGSARVVYESMGSLRCLCVAAWQTQRRFCCAGGTERVAAIHRAAGPYLLPSAPGATMAGVYW